MVKRNFLKISQCYTYISALNKNQFPVNHHELEAAIRSQVAFTASFSVNAFVLDFRYWYSVVGYILYL